MPLTIQANTPGERMVMALCVLTLCAEILSDNSCDPKPVHMEYEHCWAMCEPHGIKRMDSWSCECRGDQSTPPPPEPESGDNDCNGKFKP